MVKDIIHQIRVEMRRSDLSKFFIPKASRSFRSRDDTLSPVLKHDVRRLLTSSSQLGQLLKNNNRQLLKMEPRSKPRLFRWCRNIGMCESLT
jgi:hypothetical protein